MSRTRQETPTLTDVIKTAMETRLTDLHVMLPGEFVSFDASTGKASAKVLIKRKFEDGTTVELPLLKDIPVQMPRTESAIIYIPIKAGDKCMLLFSERSLDAWKKQSGSQDPQDRRKHHLSDAVAVPGLYSFIDPQLVGILDQNSILIENDKTRIRLKPDGRVKILNKLTQAELILILHTALLDIVAEPFILNKGLFSTLATQIQTMLDLEP